MALEKSVHVPTLAPKPRSRVPRKPPRASRKTTRPVQNESQCSMILALGCVIGLYLPVIPAPDKPFSHFQARSGTAWHCHRGFSLSPPAKRGERSEERRVGKECRS